MTESKRDRYNELVQSRKSCSLCKDELCNPDLVEEYRKFDSEIGLWSRWQGNLDADLMIVGQDWGNLDLLERNYLTEHGQEVKSNRTNQNLVELLNSISSKKLAWNLMGKNGQYFFTNAVLCLREKGMPMQGKTRTSWFNNCVGEMQFLRQQIEIVNPRVVVGLGKYAFISIMRSFGLETTFPRAMKFKEVVQKKEGIVLPGTRTRAYAVYHCGAAGWNINRSKDEQIKDWKRIARALR